MVTVSLILLVAAFVLFLLAAFSIPTPPRVNLVALGLALGVLSLLLSGWHPVR